MNTRQSGNIAPQEYLEGAALRSWPPRLCLLLLLASRALGQTPYNYQVVFDSASPVAGKTVTDVLAMDVDDSGNVAVLASFNGGTGIWSSAQNAWVVTTGQAITTAQGYPSTIGSLSGPLFGPNGVLEYNAGYAAINPNTHVGWPSVRGFFNNGQLIYELVDPNLIDCCAFQTPQKSVIYVSNPGSNILILSGTLNSPSVRLPPILQFLTTYNFIGNKETGHYAFQGTYQNADGTNGNAVFLEGIAQPSSYVVGTGGSGLPNLFLNGKDDLATNLGSATYINGVKSTNGNGTLLAFNDSDDLLLNQPWPPLAAGEITVNNNVVIRLGNGAYWVGGPQILGIPDIPSRGWLWDYKLPAINNKRQVVFAADFLPVTATEEVPNPWVVFLATPNPGFTPVEVTTTSLPDATTAQPYNAPLSATGGGPPYTWTAAGLPPGFGVVNGAIVSTGQFAAAPKTYSVTVMVTDSVGLTASATLPLVLNPMTITAVDPYPSLLPAPFAQSPSVLATGGRQVMGIAADGVAEVILRMPSSAPLLLSVASGDGGLTGVGSASTYFNTQVVVSPVNAGSAGSMVFAALQAPADFVRPGNSSDPTVTSRALTITVKSGDGSTMVQTFSLTLVRPPVVLVHGFTSSPSFWDGFTPLVSGAANPIPPSTGDPRFFLRRADYSHNVTIFHDYFGDDISVKASDLGFQYNAGPVFNQFEAFLQEYRQLAPQGSVPVAAAQVDVVGHSMGGLITRTMPYVLTSQFYSAENYMQGIVHKLIAIGGPHLGSPLAISSLAPTNICTQIGQELEGDPPISTVTINGITYTGGAADLEGDGQGGCLSPALQLLQSPSNNPPFPVSLIAGNMSAAQLTAFGTSKQALLMIPLQQPNPFCALDYGVQDYSVRGWPTLIGTPASCASSVGAPTCSDAVVPMTSAADGLTYDSSCQTTAVTETGACLSASPVTNCQNQVTLVQGVVHGPGTLELGFPPPHLQECHSNVPLRTIDLLNASVGSPEFGSLPSYPNAQACQTGIFSSSSKPQSTAATTSATPTPTLTITAPANNTTIAPGQTVTITATLTAPSNYSQVIIFAPQPIGMAAAATAGATMSFTFTVPSALPVGTYPISALAFPSTAGGTAVASQAVNLLFQGAATPVSLSPNPAVLTFRNVGDILPLDILATMPDGSVADFSRSPQITWTSDTTTVATVSADGLVTAVSPGMANITADLGNLSVKVPVLVDMAPPNPCTYTLASTSFTANPAGDSISVNVTAGAACSWSAASWVPWISVDSGSPAMGFGTISLTVSENDTGATRSGTVQIAGQSFTVNQAATNAPSLGIAKVHHGNFSAGMQGAAYSVLVYNNSSIPTSGMVTVTETPPPGLTLVSMSGTGWTCPSGGVTCTRSDSLAAGSFYPTITVTVNVSANATSPQLNSVSVSGGGSAPASAADSTVITSGSPSSGLAFYPVAPCRVVDTRGAAGPFGGPMLSAGAVRSFSIASSACNIPAAAQAYSLNITVVPPAALGYLTAWPTGQTQPVVSTLNSSNGATIANAAIVPAGLIGSVSIFVSDATHIIIDINGYFAPQGSPGALAFYPATPCRVADTRNASGPFGGPSLAAGASRSFSVPSSACGIPSTAQAYSLNMTAVPPGPLGYLTAWPTGQTQPNVSTLNALQGQIAANAAIVPAGASGAISVYVSDPSNVIVDINGYFAPPGTGGLYFYPVTPCRVTDTRNAAGTFGGPQLGAASSRNFPIPSSACGLPSTAQAYSLNMTVVPPGSLLYLSTWPQGQAQPVVSTLNDLQGQVIANAAIMPAGTSGGISVYVSDPTNLVIDINGYFGQ